MFDRETKRRLAALDDRLAAIDGRLDRIEARLADVEGAAALRDALAAKQAELDALSTQSLHVVELLNDARQELSNLRHALQERDATRGEGND